jgi:hypothetical protein
MALEWLHSCYNIVRESLQHCYKCYDTKVSYTCVTNVTIVTAKRNMNRLRATCLSTVLWSANHYAISEHVIIRKVL